MNNLLEVASQFKINGTVDQVLPLGSGLINDSYEVKQGVKRILITFFKELIIQFFRMWIFYRRISS